MPHVIEKDSAPTGKWGKMNAAIEKPKPQDLDKEDPNKPMTMLQRINWKVMRGQSGY